MARTRALYAPSRLCRCHVGDICAPCPGEIGDLVRQPLRRSVTANPYSRRRNDESNRRGTCCCKLCGRTIISKDRSGLVQTLAQVIADHSGNWIDSSMARLGGEFAGILRVDVSECLVASFEKSLAALADHGIAVTVRRDSAATSSHGRRVHLNLTGADHPGIVREVSSALACHRVSIDELHTAVRPGSRTGEPLFTAQAIVILPAGLTTDELLQSWSVSALTSWSILL
jgi:glycine cleavage system regulatory protein